MILRAIDGRLKWYQAAEILGISDACGAFIRLIPQIKPNYGPCRAPWTLRRGSSTGGRVRPSRLLSGERPSRRGLRTSGFMICDMTSLVSL